MECGDYARLGTAQEVLPFGGGQEVRCFKRVAFPVGSITYLVQKVLAALGCASDLLQEVQMLNGAHASKLKHHSEAFCQHVQVRRFPPRWTTCSYVYGLPANS